MKLPFRGVERLIKTALLFSILLIVQTAIAQNPIIGATTSTTGTSVNYYYNGVDDELYFLSNPSWSIAPGTGGTITSYSVSADRWTAYVTVRWDQPGVSTLKLLYPSTNVFKTLNVTVSCSTSPSIPTNLYVDTPICGTSGSTFATAAPGANGDAVRWYSAATGGSYFLQGTLYNTPTLTTTTNYYVSTYNTTTTCESSRTQLTVPVAPIPGAPTSATGGSNCGPGAVSLSATPGTNANNIIWYSSPTDGVAVNVGASFTTPNLPGTTSYYAQSYNSTAGCVSTTRLGVTATINTLPTALFLEDNDVYGSGVDTLKAAVSNSNWEIRWYDNQTNANNNATPNGTGPKFTTASISTSTPYYVRVRDQVTNCLGLVSTITANVIPLIAPASVQTDLIRVEGKKDEASLQGLADSVKTTTISYLDGMGRSNQKVVLRGSPTGKDVVQPIEYDSYGRTPKNYLPYVASTTDGTFRSAYKVDQGNFYLASGDKIADDANPYAISKFENSPLGRPVEQGNIGQVSQPSGGHTTVVSYGYNTGATSSQAEEVRKFNGNGSSSGFYAANTLNRLETTDPNNNKEISFTDSDGKVIVKKKQVDKTIDAVMVNYLETYYLYDDFGRVKYIIQPKGVAALKTSSWAWSQALKDQYVFEFVYDQRGRMVEKKVPGAGWNYVVYDQMNRPVLVQDANLRTANQWVFVKYDSKSRRIINGLYTDATNTTRASLQAILDAKNYDASDKYFEVRQASTAHGYSNQAFPTTSTTTLGVNYYDNYDFDFSGTDDFSYTSQGLANEGTAGPSFGLPTGSRTLVMGTTTWLYSYAFYDKFGRLIQTRSNNHLNPTVIDNLTTAVYDFEKVRQTKTYHNAGSTNQVTVLGTPKYDGAGRVLKLYHKINSNASVQVAQYDYNELGQVVDKKLHVTGASTFLQSVDYRYTILGQLESINNSQLTSDSKNDDTNDFFGMELLYNKEESGFLTASGGDQVSYDGNISAVKWKQQGAGIGAAGQRSYKYHYDKSGKLDSSKFKAYATGWTAEANTLNENISYDHNGNIYGLERKRNARGLSGTTVTSSAETIDNLTYTYASGKGNMMTKVDDAVSGQTGEAGFKNGSSTTTEYDYDAAGNLIYDKNKGIDSIKYNELGKVKRMKYADGRVVTYTYDAGGSKLTMKTYASGGALQTTTDYAQGFVYENSALSFFSSPEGRVVKNGSAFEYQYAITDHQGNTRVVFTTASASAQPITATFEGDSGDNASLFTNVNSSYVVSFTAANHTTGGTKVVRMNQNYPVGPSKSLKVYPGDKVDMDVWAYYEQNSGFGTNTLGTTAMITSIASAFGGVSGAGGESGNIFSGVNSALTGFGLGGNASDAAPAAYINYILFDMNYKVLDMGWTRVPTSAYFAKQNITIPQVSVKEAGYIFVYLSYEDQSNNYVQFDDFKVTYTPGNVIQYNEYYPYGLQTANSWTRENNKNNNLYNDGSELNTTSGWYETFFRGYDASLGRFMQVDPLATQVHVLSPYNYANNNPARFNDPNGDLVCKECMDEARMWGRMMYNIQQDHMDRNNEFYDDWSFDAGGGGGNSGVTFTGDAAIAFFTGLIKDGRATITSNSVWCKRCGEEAYDDQNGNHTYKGEWINGASPAVTGPFKVGGFYSNYDDARQAMLQNTMVTYAYQVEDGRFYVLPTEGYRYQGRRKKEYSENTINSGTDLRVPNRIKDSKFEFKINGDWYRVTNYLVAAHSQENFRLGRMGDTWDYSVKFWMHRGASVGAENLIILLDNPTWNFDPNQRGKSDTWKQKIEYND